MCYGASANFNDFFVGEITNAAHGGELLSPANKQLGLLAVEEYDAETTKLINKRLCSNSTTST